MFQGHVYPPETMRTVYLLPLSSPNDAKFLASREVYSSGPVEETVYSFPLTWRTTTSQKPAMAATMARSTLGESLGGTLRSYV